jgi:hypothetical protein
MAAQVRSRCDGSTSRAQALNNARTCRGTMSAKFLSNAERDLLCLTAEPVSCIMFHVAKLLLVQAGFIC